MCPLAASACLLHFFSLLVEESWSPSMKRKMTKEVCTSLSLYDYKQLFLCMCVDDNKYLSNESSYLHSWASLWISADIAFIAPFSIQLFIFQQSQQSQPWSESWMANAAYTLIYKIIISWIAIVATLVSSKITFRVLLVPFKWSLLWSRRTYAIIW